MKDSGVNPNEGPPTQTSLTLLDRVKRHEKEAWDRLVRLYSPLVLHWCKGAGLQLADAEEVGQEVFLAVARKMADFRRDRDGDTFRGWLRAITRTKILDHRPPPGGTGAGGSDAHQRMQEIRSEDLADSDHADAEAVEKNILYKRAVELIETSFEQSTCRAFWLLIAGRKPKDVAEELNLSPSAVYTAKSKILKRLKGEFRGLLERDSPEDNQD